MSTYQQGYLKRRSQGGLKGLGTGARSSYMGRNVQIAKNSQKKKFQQILQTIPNDGRRMRPEKKIVDIEFDQLPFSSALNLVYFNFIQEGSGFWNRIGRKICMKSLYLTGFIARNNTNGAVLPEDYNRIIVFYDRQANGANVTLANLLLTTDQAGATTTTPFSGINMNNRERFLILMDRRIYTPPVGIGGVSAGNLNLASDGNFGDNDFADILIVVMFWYYNKKEREDVSPPYDVFISMLRSKRCLDRYRTEHLQCIS